MQLSNEEKAEILLKYDADKRFGSRGSTKVSEEKLPLFTSLRSKGLVETGDDVSKPYPGFSLTDDGEREAENIFNSSSAQELEDLGKCIIPPHNAHLPLPKGSIFMLKKEAQKKKLSKLN